jgi:hypothetical protein
MKLCNTAHRYTSFICFFFFRIQPVRIGGALLVIAWLADTRGLDQGAPEGGTQATAA